MRNIIALFALVYSGFVLLPQCYSDDGDCVMMATYYSHMNTTYWTAACMDGTVVNGAIGGNTIPDICVA